MVEEKDPLAQYPYVEWVINRNGLELRDYDGNYDREMVVVPLTVTSLPLVESMSGDGYVVLSENPHYGKGRALGDPRLDTSYPLLIAARLTSVVVDGKKHAPVSWYLWTSGSAPGGASGAAYARELVVSYELRDLESGARRLELAPEWFFYASRGLCEFGAVRVASAVFGRERAILVDTAIRALLNLYRGRVSPENDALISHEGRRLAVSRLLIKCYEIVGDNDLALFQMGAFFKLRRRLVVEGARQIARNNPRA